MIYTSNSRFAKYVRSCNNENNHFRRLYDGTNKEVFVALMYIILRKNTCVYYRNTGDVLDVQTTKSEVWQGFKNHSVTRSFTPDEHTVWNFVCDNIVGMYEFFNNMTSNTDKIDATLDVKKIIHNWFIQEFRTDKQISIDKLRFKTTFLNIDLNEDMDRQADFYRSLQATDVRIFYSNIDDVRNTSIDELLRNAITANTH